MVDPCVVALDTPADAEFTTEPPELAGSSFLFHYTKINFDKTQMLREAEQ